MHKVIERYASHYLALWELDLIQPPEASVKLSPKEKAVRRKRLASAREKADHLFSLLPLAPLKEGYHPAPGTCFWIYAIIVEHYLQQDDLTDSYQAHYQALNNHQRQLELKEFISQLKAIPESRIELLTQTGPAPYWVSKPLFPLPIPSQTKETYAPNKIWKLDLLVNA